jgi:hypothetical protein
MEEVMALLKAVFIALRRVRLQDGGVDSTAGADGGAIDI